MEYQQYLRHYKWLKDQGRIEAHYAFEVVSSDKNPDYLLWRTKDAEDRIERYKQESYPGVRYRRRGSKFWVDLVAYRNPGHLDYFERAQMEIIGFSGIKPVDNQLMSPDSRIDMPSSRKIRKII